MTTTINAVMATAASQIGNYFPGNSIYGVWYAGRHGSVYKNAQFCAMGLSWCFMQHDALDIFPEHAYTPSGVNWFKARGRWHTGSINSIKRGDILYFDFPGAPYRISHVAIAEKDGANGRVQTIEFNTSGTAAGDQRNGRVVARKIRTGYIEGWGRPDYSNKAPKVERVKFMTNLRLVDLSGVRYGRASSYVTEGAHVNNLQALLMAVGYPISLDGVGGPETKEALGSFQVKTNTGDGKGHADYVVGEKTWYKLIHS